MCRVPASIPCSTSRALTVAARVRWSGPRYGRANPATTAEATR
jgi:hypothetical protein